MNQFDFYRFFLSSSKKSDLTKAGILRENIESKRDGYACYGRKAYPRWRYEASVSYMDVPASTPELVSYRIFELQLRYGMKVHAQYIARD